MNINHSLKLFYHVEQKLCALLLPRPAHSLYSVLHRPICTSNCLKAITRGGFITENESIFRKTLKKIKFFAFDRSKMKIQSYYLYETIADKIDYIYFFKEMNMPDTFNSWFLVTELHVWMLMVKAMEFGKDGRTMRNYIVEAMWADVQMRGKKLGVENFSAANEQILTLGDQFQAALLSYDEGLLSDDKVLASALWRRFHERNCNNPEKVETMVKYIRKQMHYLDKMSEDDFRARKINWFPLDKS